MAALSIQNVLEFLTARGFLIAASALRDEIVGSDGLDGSCPPLPPLRTAPNSSSSSGSSDAFVSMGSTPSELLNPYGLWSPRDKSDDPSEFGTARQCDDFNIFSQTCWYDDQRPEYLDDSYPGFLNERTNSSVSHSEDKFVMAVEEEEQLRRQDNGSSGFGELYMEVDDNHKSKHHESYLCVCCSGEASGMAESSNSLAHGYQLKQADKSSEAVPWEVNPVYDPSEEERKKLDMRLEEKDFPMTNRYTADENTLTNGRQTYGIKNGGSANCNNNTSSLANTGNLGLQQDDWNILLSEKSSQPDGIDSHELGEFRMVDRESHDSVAVGVEGEDHSTTDELQLYNSHEDDYEIFDLRIIHRKNRTGFEANKDLPIILNSVIAGRYYVTGYLGSATFSKVVQAHDLQAGIDVCLKIIKNDKDFFDQSLDEIKLLKTVNKYDPSDECHILRLYDYFYYQEHLFIVSELLGANLYEFQRYNRDSGGKMYFTLPRIQAIALQCLEALEYLHHMSIIHCDLKPENILIKSYSRCEIKIIDLGSSCFQTDNLCLYVQSRSYRAPEVILGLPYDEKIDMWSLGCVLAELYTGDVLFPNDSVVMILARMIGILGPIDTGMLEMGPETHKYFTDDYDLYHRNVESGQVECLIPEKSSLPHRLQVSDTLFVDFLECLLQINPTRRSIASEALQHQWFSFTYQ